MLAFKTLILGEVFRYGLNFFLKKHKLYVLPPHIAVA